MNTKRGIAVAGTILVDKLNEINAYPNEGELTKISSVSFSAGGLVPNNGIGLKKLCPSLPVYAMGRIGNDSEGEFVSNLLCENGVDTSFTVVCDDEKTGYTDVMSVPGGQRTFFTYSGANDSFCKNDIPWDSFPCKMLHLGYFLLHKALDSGEGVEILKEASRRGILTSIDLVSETSADYSKIIPCLEYVDNLIINEFEAGKICNHPADIDNLPKIANALFEMGVRERVIIHTPLLGICLSRDGFTYLPSFQLEDGYIKGSTGAGDAFCSGALYGIHQGLSDYDILNFAQVCAVSSLSRTDATSGIRTIDEMLVASEKLRRKTIHLEVE